MKHSMNVRLQRSQLETVSILFHVVHVIFYNYKIMCLSVDYLSSPLDCSAMRAGAKAVCLVYH